MLDTNLEDESPERVPQQDGGVNNFKLSEAMMNKKHLSKCREDVKKMKKLMVDMQVYVQQHQMTISQELVDDDKLKITTELLENSLQDRIKREIEILNVSLNYKIKKRLKMKDIENKFNTKVNSIEFNKQLERIDNNVQVFSDKVEYRLPAMELEFNGRILKKANFDEVNKALAKKADKDIVESLIGRINEFEESLSAKLAQATMANASKAQVEDDEDDDPESPDPRKKKNQARVADDDSEADRAAEQAKKAMEEALKKLNEKIEMIEKSVTSNQEEFRKAIRDQEVAMKRIEKEIKDDMEEQKKTLLAAATSSGPSGGGDGKISGAQEMLNDMFREELDKLEIDIIRLSRIDTKMNKELVQKPYAYINEVRNALDKEQKAIVTIIKQNNDKYVTKIGQMDQKVNRILTDTETLLESYRKKIKDIGKDLEQTKRYRESINLRVDLFQKSLDTISNNCDTNHTKFSHHVDHISLKFSETTVDLQSASDGYLRELDRTNILFRELQQEFVTQLEEKRQHNEALLRGAGIQEIELTRSNVLAKNTSKDKLAVLLPKLKQNHINSNHQISLRQEKILAIFKGDRLVPELNNSYEKSKQFSSPRMSIQHSNADLIGLDSLKFLPGTGIGTFMTSQTPDKQSRLNQNSRQKSTNMSGVFGARKQTQQKQLPSLDLSRQSINKTDIKTQRIDKQTLGGIKSVKNINKEIQPLTARNPIDEVSSFM